MNSSKSKTGGLELELECEAAGERGNMGVDGTRTGKVVVGDCDDAGGSGGEVDVGAGADAEEGILRGRPDAARALTTASQPVSSVLMRALSSSFSFSRARSRSCSSLSSSDRRRPARPIPARSCLFSSSNSATRPSRKENCALRRSREFWAAMRLRCARASLRSSAVVSPRARFRGGPEASSADEEAGD